MINSLLERIRPWHLCTALAVITLALFLPHAGNAFVTLDDAILIYKNLAVQQISARSLRYIFSSYDPELYVPLTLLTYQIDFAIWGLNSLGFHLTNIILHAGNAILVFWIALLLTKQKFVALITGLLFAIHPLQTEAVLWAAARKDVLSGFFFLLAIVFYLLYRRDDAKLFLWLTGLAFLFGLLAKVSIIFLPLVLLMLDWVQSGRLDRKALTEKSPLFVLCIIFGVIAYLGKTTVLGQSSLWGNALLGIKSAVFYLMKMIVPMGFSVIYPQSTSVTIASAEFFVPVLIALALIALMIFLMKRSRLAAFCIAFYFLMLLPSFTNFVKNGFYFFASDRYAYLGSIGIFLLVALLIDQLIRRGNAAKIVTGILVVIVSIGLFIQTSIYAQTWKDSEALYRSVISLYPESTLAHNNLGDVLWKAGRKDEARSEFQEALRIDPQLLSAHVNMAGWYVYQGELNEAVKEYSHATALLDKKTEINIDEVAAYFFYAQALENAGRGEDALKQYEIAASKSPRMPEPHYNLGLQYQKLGRMDDAIREFIVAVTINDRDTDAHYHLAGLYGEQGKLDLALIELDRVLALNPNYPNAAHHADQIHAILKR